MEQDKLFFFTGNTAADTALYYLGLPPSPPLFPILMTPDRLVQII